MRVLIALLLLAIPVAAAPFATIDLEVRGDTQIQGQLSGALQVPSVHLVQLPTRLEFATADTTATLYNHPTTITRVPGVGTQEERQPTEVVWSRQWTGESLIQNFQPDAFITLTPRSPEVSLDLAGEFRFHPTTLLPLGRFGMNAAEANMYRPDHPVSLLTGDISPALHQPFSLAIHGATVNDVWTGERANQTAMAPTIGSIAETRDRYVLIIETAAVPPQWSPFLGIATTHFSGQVDGDAFWIDTSGSATVDGEAVAPEHDTIHVRGDLTGTASFNDLAGAQWHLEGPATFLAADSQAILSITGTAAAVGLLTILLGSGLGRELFALMTGRYIGDPLRSQTRTELLRTVALNPGATPSELHRNLNVSRATIRHHLRVLEHADLVQVHPHGQSKAYTLNSSSFKFSIGPDQQTPAHQAFATSTHPIRDTMMALLQEGPADYERLSLKWPGTAPRQDIISYHAKKLEEAGLLARQRNGRGITFRATFDENTTMRQQVRALLVQTGLTKYMDAVLAGNHTIPDITRAVRGGPDAPRRSDTKRAVQKLHAIALINHEDGIAKPGPLAQYLRVPQHLNT